MADPRYQALSELMDGELDPDQADAVLDALCRDQALADQWRRLHRLRGLLREDADPGFDVSAAVRAAIAQEPTYLLAGLAPARPARHWRRYAVGGALAASLAVATVLGLRHVQAPGTAPQLAAQSADVITVPQLADDDLPAPVVAPASRLDGYWAAHADNTLLAGQDALAPLLRNVSADGQ